MKKGFTLIELLVVVLIIGILAAVAMPQYQKAVFKSRVAGIWPVLKTLYTAQATCKLANGQNCTFAELDIDLPACPRLPDVDDYCVYEDQDTWQNSFERIAGETPDCAVLRYGSPTLLFFFCGDKRYCVDSSNSGMCVKKGIATSEGEYIGNGFDRYDAQ